MAYNVRRIREVKAKQIKKNRLWKKSKLTKKKSYFN